MVVPQGYESQLESVLLSGEPSYFYMAKSVEEIIRNVPGVEQASGQFYLTSMSESCCDFPIQLIGFDPKTDFIVTPWAKNTNFLTQDNAEQLLAGCNITVNNKKTVTFFAKEHKITTKLAKSGSGMDNAIYGDLDTIQKIFTDAKSRGFGFISDGDTQTKTSAVFVKLKPGAKPDSTAVRIKTELPDVQIIRGGEFLSNLSDRINGFLIFPRIITILVLIITVLTLGIVFSLIVNERQKEYSILCILGADSSDLRALIFKEVFFIGLAGSLAGIFVSALAILPFNIVISEKIALPFSLESPVIIILIAISSAFIAVAASILSAVYSTIKISKKDVIFK